MEFLASYISLPQPDIVGIRGLTSSSLSKAQRLAHRPPPPCPQQPRRAVLTSDQGSHVAHAAVSLPMVSV